MYLYYDDCDFQTQHIFPTFVCTKRTSETIRLAEKLKTIDLNFGGNNLWNNTHPYVQETKSLFLEMGREVVRTQYTNSKVKIQLGRGWLNKTQPNKNIPVHHHGNGLFAGTFYVDAPEDGCNLILLDPRGCVPSPDFSAIEDISKNPCVVYIKPKQGGLVFFPNYLLHYVETNTSTNIRQSISANFSLVMPLYGPDNQL